MDSTIRQASPRWVVPRGFDPVLRAALVGDHRRVVRATRELAEERASSGVPWSRFLADLEGAWRALGHSRPPRTLVRAAAQAWPDPERRGRHRRAS